MIAIMTIKMTVMIVVIVLKTLFYDGESLIIIANINQTQ